MFYKNVKISGVAACKMLMHAKRGYVASSLMPIALSAFSVTTTPAQVRRWRRQNRYPH